MYLTTRKATIGSSTGQALHRYAAELEAYGVTIPKKSRAALDTMQENLTRLQQVRQSGDPDRAVKDVVEKLANGQGDILEVLAAASAKTITKSDPYSAYASIWQNAEIAISRRVQEVLSEHGEGWATETLRPHIEEHARTIIEAIPETLEIGTNNDAKQMEFLHHIPAVANAWAHLRGIYTVFHQLRATGVIPSTYQRDDLYEFTGNAEDIRQNLHPDSITTFCWATQNGLTPGLYLDTDHNTITTHNDEEEDNS